VRFAAEPAATASADMWVGIFESEIAPHVRRFCRPGRVTVDVGANSGYYALTFASRCRATVVAYEPDPDARRRLARNLELNPGIAPWVDVRAVAVGQAETAATVSLDADVAGTPPVGLLKVDVDGGEADVLAGARRLLADAHPDVIVETHSPALEDACGQLLLEASYSPTVITPRRLLPQNRPAVHNRWLVAAGA
jgi:predicted RNA methylase